MIKANFDTGEFKHGLKRAMEHAANEGIRGMATALQRVFDSVLAFHGGQPIDEVKPALGDACRRQDFRLDDDDLTTYATAISEGRRIVVKSEEILL